ncbi:MAG: dynamin family protein [Flavobacterium sp.]|nr:dynamin family protein [Flavobacterium sp.]
MKEKIETLLEISKSLGLSDVTTEIQFVTERLSQKNKELIIPIIGEFSSGKTTLINSLTNSKKLETSSKPTTATIYEIYFESETEFAELYYSDGKIELVDDISSLKNDELDDVPLIKVHDTSNKISSSTILVDTPGLSSNDARHIEALSKYLPNADALLLFVDINQQITNSLLDFIKTRSLTHLSLYLVITKSDTKDSCEIDSIKAYISKNINLSVENIISISSVKNELTEFFILMNNIQKDKNQIIDKVLSFRIENISKYLANHIEDLIKNSSSDVNLDNEIKSQKRTLDKLNFAIDKLISDTRFNLEDIGDVAKREFENHVSDKLDAIIKKQDANADSQAVGVINSTANITLSNFQNNVRKCLYLLANDRKNSDSEIPLRFLESVDLSNAKMDSFDYNIDLSSAGQETIKNISNGLKIAAAVAAVAVTAGAAAAAIAPAAAGTSAAVVGTEAVVTAGTLLNVADTVTDVANIASNVRTQKVLQTAQKIGQYVEMTKINISAVNDYNVQAGSIVSPNTEQGFVESIVGNVSDGMLGKPQRKKMINSYLESSLIPQFKSRMSDISFTLLSEIKNSLENEAAQKIAQMESNLLELQNLSANEKELFNNRIIQLKEFKTKLI